MLGPMDQDLGFQYCSSNLVLQKFQHGHARCAVLGLGDVGYVGERAEHEDGLAAGEILKRLE